MAHKYILDTHALIWYLEGSPKLSPAAQAVMANQTSEMILPIIALSEAIYAVDKGRTKIPSINDLLSDVLTEKRIEIQPLTLEILQQTLRAMIVPEMHDRLVVAAALYVQNLGHQVSVITKDSEITASSLVQLVW